MGEGREAAAAATSRCDAFGFPGSFRGPLGPASAEPDGVWGATEAWAVGAAPPRRGFRDAGAAPSF